MVMEGSRTRRASATGRRRKPVGGAAARLKAVLILLSHVLSAHNIASAVLLVWQEVCVVSKVQGHVSA